MKRKELEKRMDDAGWLLLRYGRRHDIWSCGERKMAVPRHREINEYTAKVILREVEGKTR